MAALHLTSDEQALARIDRDLAAAQRRIYECALQRLEREGSLSVAYREKINAQIAACDKAIERFDRLIRQPLRLAP